MQAAGGFGYKRLPTLKVVNLNVTTSMDTLCYIFERYGRIAHVTLCLTMNHYPPINNGYAYIKYYHVQDAVNAAFNLDQMIFEGRNIRIYLMGRNLRDRMEARRAIELENAKHMHHQYATVKVANIANNLTEDDLMSIFNICGPIVDVHVPKVKNTRLNRGYGFVRFLRKEDANYAIASFHKAYIRGRVIIVLEAKY